MVPFPMSQSLIERAARALCRADGLPENIAFEGRPMWRTYVPKACAVLEALRDPSFAVLEAADNTPCSVKTSDLWRAMIDAALAEPLE